MSRPQPGSDEWMLARGFRLMTAEERREASEKGWFHCADGSSVPDGSDSDTASYSQEIGIAENIITGCIIFFFLILPILIGIFLACTAFIKPPKTEYIIQSAYCEVRP